MIPSNRIQCKFCDAENVTQFSTNSSEDTTDKSWSYGRVVLAVVSASNRYLAAALGSAAFGLADPFVDADHVSHSDVQTVYDFTTAPATALTTDWGVRPSFDGTGRYQQRSAADRISAREDW